jgi:hypothetical protein
VPSRSETFLDTPYSSETVVTLGEFRARRSGSHHTSEEVIESHTASKLGLDSLRPNIRDNPDVETKVTTTQVRLAISIALAASSSCAFTGGVLHAMKTSQRDMSGVKLTFRSTTTKNPDQDHRFDCRCRYVVVVEMFSFTINEGCRCSRAPLLPEGSCPSEPPASGSWGCSVPR